jgi:hypothetical protein
MNLAKYVSWDTLISTAGGLLAGISIGAEYGWLGGCWAFTGGQYLIHNFLVLNRIERNQQELLLRLKIHDSLDTLVNKLEALRKEAELNNERQP